MPFTVFAQQLFGRKIFWIRLQKLKSYLFYVDINVFMTFFSRNHSWPNASDSNCHSPSKAGSFFSSKRTCAATIDCTYKNLLEKERIFTISTITVDFSILQHPSCRYNVCENTPNAVSQKQHGDKLRHRIY